VSVLLCLSVNFSIDAHSDLQLNAQKTSQNCLADKWSKSQLLALKDANFKIENEAKREQLAIAMLNCLAHPDPELRDGIAFEGLSKWLRTNSLKNEILIKMLNTLQPVLNAQVDDVNGVYKPFAALVLSELARVDRKSAYLTDKQRQTLVKEATSYVENQRDYRGFDSQLGWLHGVAHGADLLLQLSLNPQVNKAQLDIILHALSSQVKANDAHFYVYGEPKRLAMPLVYVFLRNEHSDEDWKNWIERVTDSAPLSNWGQAYKNQKSLAQLHNLQSFLYSLYASIKNSKNEVLLSMIPELEKAIRTVR
jgi:hypothetical protein